MKEEEEEGTQSLYSDNKLESREIAESNQINIKINDTTSTQNLD